MKGLMQLVQAGLRQKVAGVRDRDVFLTPDADIVPAAVKFPCIGIKDGRVTRTYLMGGRVELGLPLEISVYVKLIVDEQAVVDLLEMAEAVQAALKSNYFDGYVTEISPGDEAPIRVMVKKGALILRKTVFYSYLREAAA